MAIRFAMCNEFCQGWDFARVCALAAECGYDAVELAPFTLSDSVENITASQRQALRETARKAGLEIVGLHWLLVKPEGLYINSRDEALRRRTTDYLKKQIEFCADIGGTRMVVGSPKQRNVTAGDTYEAAWDRTVEVFKELAPIAHDSGVCLCFEPLAPTETNFVNTAAEARRLVEAVDHPGFQMMLDVKAMSGDVEPIPDIIRKSARYVKHFHANDANRSGPGFGDTDYRPIVKALREIRYGGYVSVEVFDFSPGPERIARESIRYLKEVFSVK
jgi:sugar phosphate isomerase/epimerase